jgi:hypothetical protein
MCHWQTFGNCTLIKLLKIDAGINKFLVIQF